LNRYLIGDNRIWPIITEEITTTQYCKSIFSTIIGVKRIADVTTMQFIAVSNMNVLIDDFIIAF
jgi:hypothetical protein